MESGWFFILRGLVPKADAAEIEAEVIEKTGTQRPAERLQSLHAVNRWIPVRRATG
jgi:hypothetical protein